MCLSFFIFWDIGLVEGLDEELVHPLADVESCVHTVLYWEQGVSAARIVVQPSFDTFLFESGLIEIGLMRWNTQVFVAYEELTWCDNVLHMGHWGAIKEIDLLLDSHG